MMGRGLLIVSIVSLEAFQSLGVLGSIRVKLEGLSCRIRTLVGVVEASN